MFSFLSSLVIHHPRAVVLGWLVLTAGLHSLAPPWDRVTKDDDVRFFPADSPSVIGARVVGARLSPGCLGHPARSTLRTQEWSFVFRRSQFCERRGRKHRPICPKTSGTRGHEDRHLPIARDRSAVDRFQRRWSRSGGAVNHLAEQHPLAQKTQVAVNRIMEWFTRDKAVPPPGLRRVVTGSAVVGHDTNTATNDSIQSTKNTTIALVILILLVVYRSPLLAMVPLVTIALSAFASLD